MCIRDRNKKIEKRWPIKTPNAAKCEAVIPKDSLAKNTTIEPLATSMIKVRKAADLFPVLKTFVAPTFPEPTFLISPKPNNFVKINAKGNDPIT